MPDKSKPNPEIPVSCKLITHGKYRGWIEMPRFALVDEHTYFDEEPDVGADGKPIKNEKGEIKKSVVPVKLDRGELERISNVCNQRIGNTGDYCPIAVGHTKDKLPTKFQPPIAGYAKEFAVEPFVNDETGEQVIDHETGKPKLAIYATPFAEPENLRVFLDHPRRSIELRFHEGTIDPLSILSSETPARDLGLHKFSASESPVREKPYIYSINDTKQVPEKDMADPNKAFDSTGDNMGEDSKIANLVFEDARWKKMESIISKLGAMLEGGEAEGQPAGGDMGAAGTEASPDTAGPDAGAHGDDLLGPAGTAPDAGAGPAGAGGDADSYGDEPFDLTMEDPDKDGDGHETDKEKEDKVKKDQDGSPDSEKKTKMAACSAPGVGNTFIPGNKGKAKMSAQTQNLEEPIQMARDRQEKARFAKMEQRLVAVENENKSLREQNEIKEVQNLLAGLDVEGIDYDPTYEMPKLVRMSKDEKAAHIEYMRTKYKAAVPGGGKVAVAHEHQAPMRFARADQTVPANSTADATPVETSEIGRIMVRDKCSKEDAVAKFRGTAATGVVKVR